MSITLPLQRATIDRDTSRMVVEVPEQELRVLRAVHGTINVTAVPAGRNIDVQEDSAEAEFARLAQTYNRMGENPVVMAFPDGPEGLRRYGFRMAGDAEPSKRRAA